MLRNNDATEGRLSCKEIREILAGDDLIKKLEVIEKHCTNCEGSKYSECRKEWGKLLDPTTKQGELR